MMLTKPYKIHHLILSVIFTGVIVLNILLLLNPAAIFPDASWGFQVLRSMQHGSGFNIITQVSTWDISANTSEFKSWWSPGQYLVPALFKTLLGIKLGQAISITIILCQLSGLAGLYACFKKAGFSQMISALSVGVICLQQAFFSPYIFYSGGEVLLFGVIGWFLYGCLSVKKPGPALVAFVLLSGWVGFIAKSSFLWMYGAGLIFIWIQLSKNSSAIVTWLRNGFWIGVPAVLSVAVIYLLYLSKGNNPSSQSGGLSFSVNAFTFPLASPLLAGFSFDDLANGFIFHNDTILFSPVQAKMIIAILALLSMALVYFICKRSPFTAYNMLMVLVYGFAILFFGWAYLRKADISYEGRHFRTVGLVVVPGTIYLFSNKNRILGYMLGTLVAVIGFFSIRFYTRSYIALKQDTAHGPTGIAQQFIDQPSLNYIHQLDLQNHNAIFVFLSPDLGLEIQNNRIITLDPLNRDISINFDEYLHKGHAGPVYILLPHEYIGVRANMILKAFPRYKGFSLKELSDDYVLYFATQAR
ncbi:hypothetical protein [Mucilaginibacter sp.]|uniref:hypothetical protein n=1 Tax=Mucilaginibacter sp. TaxID=1882438 RepID=UPI000CB0B9D9|nr:hypothetical protein [Mucilaginibacter sp.]PLW91175.1 MAG: hypothetical protein C0154_02645 [Mucilaginibacter sp.]HEK21128.1 hypothetical protein [Bacteroidota bacterium]